MSVFEDAYMDSVTVVQRMHSHMYCILLRQLRLKSDPSSACEVLFLFNFLLPTVNVSLSNKMHFTLKSPKIAPYTVHIHVNTNLCVCLVCVCACLDILLLCPS